MNAVSVKHFLGVVESGGRVIMLLSFLFSPSLSPFLCGWVLMNFPSLVSPYITRFSASCFTCTPSKTHWWLSSQCPGDLLLRPLFYPSVAFPQRTVWCFEKCWPMSAFPDGCVNRTKTDSLRDLMKHWGEWQERVRLMQTDLRMKV